MSAASRTREANSATTSSTAARMIPANEADIAFATRMVDEAVAAYKSFNPKVDTVDSHFDSWSTGRKLVSRQSMQQSLALHTRLLASHCNANQFAIACNHFDPQLDDEEDFVQQLFYGAVRQKKVLGVLLNALFHTQGAELPRSEHDRLQVIAYCIMFRPDELG